MKFIIDAQLPPTLKHFFNIVGTTVHTFVGLAPAKRYARPGGTRHIATSENRIVVTKDADFYYSFVLNRQPSKLVLVKTGNLSTKALIDLFAKTFDQLIILLTDYDFVSISQDGISQNR